MSDMKFDLDKIVTDSAGPQHNIKYIVYAEKSGFYKEHKFSELKEEIEAGNIKGKENTTKVCFAGFKYLIAKDSNRILFKVKFKQKNAKELHLTNEEIKKWTNLCKHHGLMPWYIGNHFTDTGNFILKLEDTFTMSKIYMILSAARNMQEYPEVVRATIYLRSLGLNFFLAFLAASRCTIQNSGHSIFKHVKEYSGLNDPHKVTVDPRYALALKKYIEKGHNSDIASFLGCVKAKKKDIYDQHNSYYFRLHDILCKLAEESDWPEKGTKISELFSKEIQGRLK